MVELNEVLLTRTTIADFVVPTVADPFTDNNWVTLVDESENEAGVIIDPFTFNPPGSEQVFTTLRFNEENVLSTVNGALPSGRTIVPKDTKIEYDNRFKSASFSVYTCSLNWDFFDPALFETAAGSPLREAIILFKAGSTPRPVLTLLDDIEFVEEIANSRSKVFFKNGKVITVDGAVSQFDPFVNVVTA